MAGTLSATISFSASCSDRSVPRSVPSKPAGREAESLRHVVAGLADRDRIIGPDRAERRVPDQAGAERRADRARIRDLQRLRQGGQGTRAAIAPQAAGIGEDADL